MRPFSRFICWALLCVPAVPCVATAADQSVSLASVARSANLEYGWLYPTTAVQLSAPGIIVLVRPGDNIFDVNDRVEVTAVTPRFANNDIYVSPVLAKHIETLARQARNAYFAAQEARHEEESAEAGAASVPQLQGTIVLKVTPLHGAEALYVEGTAPPAAPVLLTLDATLSSELPNILLSRHELTAGPDGKFQAIVPIAPNYMRNTFINVLATSVPGVTSASAQILVDAPNAGIKVPAEQQPGGIW